MTTHQMTPSQTFGGQPVEFDPTAPSVRINPFDFASDEASRNVLIDLFERMEGVAYTPEARTAAMAILESLPAGSSLVDFIHAADTQAAASLGISLEALNALKPLLTALRGATLPGPMSAMLENASQLANPVQD